MYIRIETRGSAGGLFVEADLFRQVLRTRGERVSRKDAKAAADLLDWLERRTPVPPAESYRSDAGPQPRTWFKESAWEHVEQAWRLCLVLNRNGVPMRPLRSTTPGVIRYEDDVQVVVRPHREALSRRRRTGRAGWTGDRETIRRWTERDWRDLARRRPRRDAAGFISV